MNEELLTACNRALTRFLAQTQSLHDWHIADRAVTLHCLKSVAPTFFERHGLGPELAASLEGLSQVSSNFPSELPWAQVMARLDAHYFRALYGLANGPLPHEAIRFRIAAARDESVLVAWLLAEFAQWLGIELEIPDPSGLRGQERLYWRTHQILLWTNYLRDPLRVDAAEALDELAQALPTRLLLGDLDLAAEAIFCLFKAGRTVPAPSLNALLARQRDDGGFGAEEQSFDEREAAHCTGVCLIALACGLSLPR